MFTGVGPKVKQLLDKSNAQHWAVDIHEKKSYLNVVPDRSKLVYLSADSENLINDLDPEDIYIIGGIVDHNKHKKLTYTKANDEKIRHARLPIQENIQLGTSAVLTVNHVFDIICNYLRIKDWKETMQIAIPTRKVKSEEVNQANKGKEDVVEKEEVEVEEESKKE